MEITVLREWDEEDSTELLEVPSETKSCRAEKKPQHAACLVQKGAPPERNNEQRAWYCSLSVSREPWMPI